ncbi:hypothetical protein ABW21_db0200591 [Orbilia brochopaga]|nr:hypothetical protein ABW21_db0200591 [Drechslerella brochopaga]
MRACEFALSGQNTIDGANFLDAQGYIPYIFLANIFALLYHTIEMSIPSLRRGGSLPPISSREHELEDHDDACTQRRSSRPHLAIALNPHDSMASSRTSTPRPILPHSNSNSNSTTVSFPSSIATPTSYTHESSPAFPLSPPTISHRYIAPDIPRASLTFPDASARDMTSRKSQDDIFTPPTTPASTATRKEIDTGAPPPSFRLERSATAHWDSSSSESDMAPSDSGENQETTMLLSPPYELDDATHPTRLGSGAWSNVYKGTLIRSGLLVAVKRPLNAFSIPAVRREAAILSHVQRRVSSTSSTPSIIPFHGFDPATDSIVMTALSGENLDQFAKSRTPSTHGYTSSLTVRRQPVVGIPQYLFICERLVGAFAFLKSAGVIHGDVKPQNILMRAASTTSTTSSNIDMTDEEKRMLMEPVVADFSSGYVVDMYGNIADDEEAISAVTTIYCAPELLAAFLHTPPTTPTKREAPDNTTDSLASSRPEPRPLPTFASDVYSLGMTLLQTALGSHPYAAARVEMQRNMWVRQGDPIAFARADERGIQRVRNGGIVERLVRGCFGKTADGRTGVQELVGRVEMLSGEWRERRTKGVDGWV